MSVITFVGNLAADVELRYTPNGRAVARFRVIENRRHRDADGNWADAEPNTWRVQAWGDLAENVAASCSKGARVHVTGEMHTTRWTDDVTGAQRTIQRVEADEVSYSMRYHRVEATKVHHNRQDPAPSQATPPPSWDAVTTTTDDQPL